jgi:hypothetical protein
MTLIYFKSEGLGRITGNIFRLHGNIRGGSIAHSRILVAKTVSLECVVEETS